MPRFRFTAADSTGTLHDGTIDARTDDDARNRLAANGLAVRTVEEVAADDSVPADVPHRPAPKPAAVGPPAAARAKAPERPAPAPAPKASRLPLVFSGLALVVAVATAAYVVRRDPPWGRLGRYDFSTPEAAALSLARMDAANDYRARLEAYGRMEARYQRERAETLRVRRSETYRGRTALFIEYERNGRPRREVQWYEKNPDTGQWQPARIIPFNLDQTDRRLAEAVQAWATPFDPEDEFEPGEGADHFPRR